jgi:methyltransferase
MDQALILYILLLGLVSLQRLWELRKSSRNEKALLSRGGRVLSDGHYGWMKLLHGSWLGACLIESYFVAVPPPMWLVIPALVILAAGQILRILAIQTLGERWTTRIVVLPGHPPVQKGIYNKIRHPNYLGVILEITSLPLVYGCFVTAIVYSLANALLLKVRISAEEQALSEFCQYQDGFKDLSAFVPRNTRS